MWTSWSGQHDALKGKTPQQGSGPDKWTDNRCPFLWFRLQLFTRRQVKKKIWYIHKSGGQKGTTTKKLNKKEKITPWDFFTSLSHFVTYTPNHRWLNSPRLDTGSHQLKPFVNKHSKFRALILTEKKIALVEKQLTNFINVNAIICEASAAVRKNFSPTTTTVTIETKKRILPIQRNRMSIRHPPFCRHDWLIGVTWHAERHRLVGRDYNRRDKWRVSRPG